MPGPDPLPRCRVPGAEYVRGRSPLLVPVELVRGGRALVEARWRRRLTPGTPTTPTSRTPRPSRPPSRRSAASTSPRSRLPEPLAGGLISRARHGLRRHRAWRRSSTRSRPQDPDRWEPFAPTEAPLLKLFGLRHTTFSAPRAARGRRGRTPADRRGGRGRRGGRWPEAKHPQRATRPEPCVLYFLGYEPTPA